MSYKILFMYIFWVQHTVYIYFFILSKTKKEMGIWNDLKSLGEDYLSKLPELYTKRNFPWEVRGMFADWFEEQNW